MFPSPGVHSSGVGVGAAEFRRAKVTEENIRQLAACNQMRSARRRFRYRGGIVLQDFTGVPLLVDLAAMRSAVQLGEGSKIIEPLVPVDLVVDHSVQVDSRVRGCDG